MQRYIIRRLLWGIVAVIGVSMLIFVATRISGDATVFLVPADAHEEDFERARREYGLDKPIYVQYAVFVSKAVRGDLGRSWRWRQPAMKLILERLPATMELAVVAACFSIVMSISFGTMCAVKRDSWLDNFGKVFALLGQSMPTFWVGLLLIMAFAVYIQILPTSGRVGFRSLILPAITLGWFPVAAQMRITRSAMLDVLDSEYIKMARIKGAPETLVIFKHALRNAAIPVVTLMGIQWAHLLGGSVVVETIFAWPGVGRTMIEAINNRDYTVVQAGALLISVIFVLINLLVDVMYGVLDPRIRYQ